MTQEDKELLLKDISGRLPYCPIVQITLFRNGGIKSDIELDAHVTENIWEIIDKYHALPYLRPMDSMTEEEIEILKSKCIHTETEEDWEHVRSDVWGIQILDKYDTRRWDNTIYVSNINMSAIDWLIANHFDYRGLIPIGLAIEVTKENNPYEY